MTCRVASVLSLAVVMMGCPQPDPTFSVNAEQLGADLAAIDARLEALEASVATLQDNQGDLMSSVAALQATVGTGIDGADPLVTAVSDNATALAPVLALADGELEEMIDYVGALDEYLEIDDTADELIIEGANLRLINDTGSPNTGNLLVGGQDAAQVTGQHSIYVGTGHVSSADESVIVGTDHSAEGTGVFISGDEHEVTGNYSVAAGGETNSVSGVGSVALGGLNHTIGGTRSAVLGGASLDLGPGTTNSVLIGGSNNMVGSRINCVVIGDTNVVGCPEDNGVDLPPPPASN